MSNLFQINFFLQTMLQHIKKFFSQKFYFTESNLHAKFHLKIFKNKKVDPQNRWKKITFWEKRNQSFNRKKKHDKAQHSLKVTSEFPRTMKWEALQFLGFILDLFVSLCSEFPCLFHFLGNSRRTVETLSLSLASLTAWLPRLKSYKLLQQRYPFRITVEFNSCLYQPKLNPLQG